MLAGVITPFVLAWLNLISLDQAIIAFFFLGIVLGFGLPSGFAYFAEHTIIDNRGLVGGVLSFFTLLIFIPAIVLFGTMSLMTNYIALALWRTLGLALFWLLTYGKKTIPFETRGQKSFFSILHDKNFLLYLMPWLMFWLVDRSEGFLLRDFLKNSFGLGFYTFFQLALLVISCFSAFISGVLSDRVGRKRVATSGFISLGLGYAAIGLAPQSLFSWYLWIFAEGIAWGTFFTLFILVLWGDLSGSNLQEKYYVLGNVPFFLTSVIQLFLAPVVALITPSSAFSLAAFFLFLAVLPLMYAPETLPEKKIELRRLKGYIEQAKKVRDKYLKKNGAND
jgi:MFS family permease